MSSFLFDKMQTDFLEKEFNIQCLRFQLIRKYKDTQVECIFLYKNKTCGFQVPFKKIARLSRNHKLDLEIDPDAIYKVFQDNCQELK